MNSDTDETGAPTIEESDARVSRRAFVAKSAGVAAGIAGASMLGPAAHSAHAARPAAFTYPRYDGTTINALMVSGEDDAEPLRDAVADIKQRFGIKLVVTDLAIGTMHDKGLASLRAGTATYDIIDVLGYWAAEFVGPGYFTPLDSFVSSAKLTAPGFDLGDFTSQQLDYVGYFNTKTQSFGKPGALYMIPGAHAGGALMYYREDLLKAHGLAVPKTWQDYQKVCQALNNPGNGMHGTSFVGANDPSLFLVDWYCRFVSDGGQLMSGSPTTHNYMPHVDSPKGILALQRLLDVKPFAPTGVGSYGFTESVDAMSKGKVGIMIMWGTIAGPLYDPAQSKVAGKVVATHVPGTGQYAGQNIRGGWGLGIPKNSPHKEAAWQVIQYFTSRQAEIYRTLKYNIEPCRLSSHRDPQVVKRFPFMPALADAYVKSHTLEISNIPETFELIAAATRQFNLAVIGQQTAAQACKKTNSDWIAILKRGGHLA